MLKRVIAAAAGLGLIAAGFVGVSTLQASALGKVKCKVPAGYAQVDPIVNHGAPQSAHLHVFLGNTTLLTLPHPENATYTDLVGKSTACENPDDTAAYWFPALVYTSGPNAGQPVPVHAFDAYYRSFDHKKQGVAAPFAPDTRLVAGNSHATMPQPLNIVNWTCSQHSSRPQPEPSITAADCAKATGIVRLTLHVTFPSCWDGTLADHTVNGDTQDTAHFAYFDKRTDSCPAGFPNKMAELRETLWFDYTGDGSDVALSSDLMMDNMGMPVAPGTTAHADFWNTWQQTGGVYGGLAGMVNDCIVHNTGSARECG